MRRSPSWIGPSEDKMMNYVPGCTIDELPDRMNNGVWWLIHIQSKTSFWESWGIGKDDNAHVRSGKIGTRGSDQARKWEEVLEEARKTIQKGYSHVMEARIPVWTKMMPGGYARTSIDASGTYGIDFLRDDSPKEELPPAYQPRTVLPRPKPKPKAPPRPKMTKDSGAFRSEGELPSGRSFGYRPGFIEEKEAEAMKILVETREKARLAKAKEDEKRRVREENEKEINTIKDMMNKRKQASEW